MTPRLERRARAIPAWTSVCSAGATIDKASTPGWRLVVPAGTLSTLSMASMGFVTARYNVTNTAIPPLAIPPWATLGFLALIMGGNRRPGSVFESLLAQILRLRYIEADPLLRMIDVCFAQ
jgi:hypothetical protein